MQVAAQVAARGLGLGSTSARVGRSPKKEAAGLGGAYRERAGLAVIGGHESSNQVGPQTADDGRRVGY